MRFTASRCRTVLTDIDSMTIAADLDSARGCMTFLEQCLLIIQLYPVVPLHSANAKIDRVATL